MAIRPQPRVNGRASAFPTRQLALIRSAAPEAEAALTKAIAMLEEIEGRAAAALARTLAQRTGIAGHLPKPRHGPCAAAAGIGRLDAE